MKDLLTGIELQVQGPWHGEDLQDGAAYFGAAFIYDEKGRQVCVVSDSGQEIPLYEVVANNILIAEAPELFKALLAAHHALRSYQYGNVAPDGAAIAADHALAVLRRAAGMEASE